MRGSQLHEQEIRKNTEVLESCIAKSAPEVILDTIQLFNVGLNAEVTCSKEQSECCASKARNDPHEVVSSWSAVSALALAKQPKMRRFG